MIYNRDLLTAALTKVPGSWQVPQGPTLTFQVGREVGSTTVQDIVKDVQGREYVTRLHLSQLALGCCHPLKTQKLVKIVKWRRQAPLR